MKTLDRRPVHSRICVTYLRAFNSSAVDAGKSSHVSFTRIRNVSHKYKSHAHACAHKCALTSSCNHASRETFAAQRADAMKKKLRTCYANTPIVHLSRAAFEDERKKSGDGFVHIL